MDRETFSDPKVAQLLNEKFYPVKFNGEQKEDVVIERHHATSMWPAAVAAITNWRRPC